MLNFVLCDDNLNILSKLAKMLESIFIEHQYDAKIGFQSTNANEILNYVLNNVTNVLILDINLKSNISGIELAQKVRKDNKNIYIIFTTAHLEYALLAYKVKTFDYIAKPLTIERLEDTLVRLFDDILSNPKQYIHIGNSKVLVKKEDIQFIRKQRNESYIPYK